jgi:NADPH:quinone reductase
VASYSLMKAVVCHKLGSIDQLTVEDGVASTAPVGTQVRIRVHAAGVNFPDLLMVQGKYQVKPPPPFTPGAECVGTVLEVGSTAQRVRVGERVIALPAWGAFAEEVTVDESRVLPVPDGIDDAIAAGLVLTYGTSHHALVQRAALQPGETLLVLGAAGGVGLAAVEIGARLGARVIAAASTKEKLAICREHGAAETVCYGEGEPPLKDAVKALTGGKGADVIYDPVGGDLFDASMRCIAWKGRLLVVGFASGRIPQLPANLALIKGCSVVGVFWGAFVEREPMVFAENMRQLYSWVLKGELRPFVSERVPLANAKDALRTVEQRKAVGKIILTT